MVDYYKKFKLDCSASFEDLQKRLDELENVYKRRWLKDSSGAARKKLDLITDARKVFASQETKLAYDQSLAQAKTPVQGTDPEAERDEQFGYWVDKAWDHLDADEYDLAFAAFEKAQAFSDRRSEDVDFCWLATRVHSEIDRFNEALDYINRAIIQDESDADFEYEKAEILFNLSEVSDPYYQGSYKKRACDSARIAVEKARKAGDRGIEGQARALLSYLLYTKLGQVREAEEEAKRAVRLCDEPPCFAQEVLDDITRKREEEQERQRKAEEKERWRKAEEERRRLKAEEETRERKRKAEEKEREMRRKAEEEAREKKLQEMELKKWEELQNRVFCGGMAAFVVLWLVVHLPGIYLIATGNADSVETFVAFFSWYNPYLFNILFNIGIAGLGISFGILSADLDSGLDENLKIPAVIFTLTSLVSLGCYGPGVIANTISGFGTFFMMGVVDWVVLFAFFMIGCFINEKHYSRNPPF